MQPTMFLQDDGTLDTVFQCGCCKATLRYDGEAFERNEDGSLTDEDSVMATVRTDHADECGIDSEYYSQWEE